MKLGKIICVLFEANYCLQFARKLTFVKLSIPLNYNKGNKKKQEELRYAHFSTRWKKLETIVIGGINSFVVLDGIS